MPYKRGKLKGSGPYFIYFVRCQHFVKIGITNDPAKRFNTLQTANPFELSLLYFERVKSPEVELDYHKKFENYHFRGEWYYHKGWLRAWLGKKIDSMAP